MPTTAHQLVLERQCLFLQLSTGIFGKALLRVKIIKTISFTITGIGSGIGELPKPATTQHMSWIAVVGFWALIIPQKLHQAAAVMLLKTIGKHRIRRSLHLNLGLTKQ